MARAEIVLTGEAPIQEVSDFDEAKMVFKEQLDKEIDLHKATKESSRVKVGQLEAKVRDMQLIK